MRVESVWIPCLWTRDLDSLDEDALEQALKALLQLTEGNRLVGIISHVSELKDQIDKKIIVTKQRTPEGVSSVARVE